MGLEDFASDDSEDNNGSSSQREYVRITKEEFEEFLTLVDNSWGIVSEDEEANKELRNFSREYIYKMPLRDAPEELQLRIFSTIDKRTDVCRDKGADAIRCVIWDSKEFHPVGGRKKTLRIKTWKKNLRNKIEELKADWEEHTTPCDECGSWLVKREGEYGEFLGCIRYPRCDNTRQIE